MTAARDFWSRRKAAVAAETEAVTAAEREAQEAEARTEIDALSDTELLDRLNLPVPESLVPGDDFSAFMSHAVPARLRRRALRTLWRSNPVLANVDGLVDYGDDFTDRATVVENLKTAYSVGRGMLAHLDHVAQAQADPPAAPDMGPEVVRTAEQAPDADPPSTADADEIGDDAAHDVWPTTPAPRRMAFRYDSETA